MVFTMVVNIQGNKGAVTKKTSRKLLPDMDFFKNLPQAVNPSDKIATLGSILDTQLS